MRRLVTPVIAVALLAGCARFHSRPILPAETAAALDARTLDDAHFRAFLEKNAGHPFDAWPLRSWDLDTLTLAAWYISRAWTWRERSGAPPRGNRDRRGAAEPDGVGHARL